MGNNITAAQPRRVGAVAAPQGHEHYFLDVTGECTCACGYVAADRNALLPHYDFERAGHAAELVAVHNAPADLLAWCERQLIAMAAGARVTAQPGELTFAAKYKQPIAHIARTLGHVLAVAA